MARLAAKLAEAVRLAQLARDWLASDRLAVGKARADGQKRDEKCCV